MEEIINEIITAIKLLNLPYEINNNLIKIKAELLDATSSVNIKKIQFECLIYFVAKNKNLLYFQKIEESSSGLVFAKSFESYSQSGSSLNKKVKFVQYGIDGKEYSYSFDLGQLQKSVKEISKKHNAKFKNVISRKKIEKSAKQ